MAVKQREYLFSINEYKDPTVLTERKAIALMLVRLIMLEPGTDPLHPLMGVGIKKYRYSGVKDINKLCSEIESQIRTYLPEYQNATVSVEVTKEKLLNIEIAISDVVYVYESATSQIPIKLSDIENN